MTTKRAKSQHSYTLNAQSFFILKQLLNEFRAKKRGMADLQVSYVGLAMSELKDRCANEGFDEVDYDLALEDLERSGLMGTGPQVMYDNPPYSGVIMIGFYSKREWTNLTENGYKEAVNSASDSKERPAVKAGGGQVAVIHGSQYINYGQAGAIGPHSTGTINLSQQWVSIQNEVDLNALTIELEQLRKHLQQSASSTAEYQQLTLLSQAEEHAKKHEGSKAMEVLSKLTKGTFGIAKDIGTEIAAKVIAKSMGLEP